MAGWNAIAVSIAGALTSLFVLRMAKGRQVGKRRCSGDRVLQAIGTDVAAFGLFLGDMFPGLFN